MVSLQPGRILRLICSSLSWHTHRLGSWHEHADPRIKYYSGPVHYRKAVDIPAELVASGRRLMLDLGRVVELAEVRLNGQTVAVAWCPPFAVDVTAAAKAGKNKLDLIVVNGWRNRWMGDEQLPPDVETVNLLSFAGPKVRNPIKFPDWAKQGRKSPNERILFSTFMPYTKSLFQKGSGPLGSRRKSLPRKGHARVLTPFGISSKHDPLEPTGLLGPVVLRGDVIAEMKQPTPQEKTPMNNKDSAWRLLTLAGVALAVAASGGVKAGEIVKPLLDVAMRHPNICRGPEGTYYLTGTTPKKLGDGSLDWNNGTAVRLLKSKDLATWEEVGIVWDLAKTGWNERWSNAPRALPGVADGPRHYLGITAPEIHYLKDTFWIAYAINGQGTGLLRSKSGKAEGPYEPWGKGPNGLTYITAGGADPSMFQDDDGAVYWLWSPAWIAKMKDDLTGLAEAPRMLTCQPRVESPGDVVVGHEGPFLFKADGKYHLCVAALMPRLGIHTLDTMVATSSELFGPYSKKEMMIPHGGQSTVFRDGEGNWHATFWGRDRFAAFRDKAGIVPLEWLDRVKYLMWRPNNPLLMANPEKVFTERGPWHKLRPILDKPGMNIRDMNMIQAPDGFFYFTGSVYGEAYKGKLTIFRSRDLKTWEEIVVRTFADEKDVPEARRNYRTATLGDWCNYYMDCEIHYLPKQKNFFVAYNAYAPRNLPDPRANVGFGGVLRSKTGRGEGPYEKIRDGACQSGFFEDDDGTLYEYWGINGLRRLNSDFSKAGDLLRVNRTGGGLCGEDSGCYLVKMYGKYVFFTTECPTSNQHWVPTSAHSYDFNYMIADRLEGPWSEWMPGVRHGGHGGVFRGVDGHWYGVVWGEDILGAFHCKPGMVRLKTEFTDGQVLIDVDDDWTPDDYVPADVRK